MEKSRILLGSARNRLATNVDSNVYLPLSKNEKHIQDYELFEIISNTELYSQERENSNKYKIYGNIEMLSPLYGVNSAYSDITFFYDKTKKNPRANFSEYFDMQLCVFHDFIDSNGNVLTNIVEAPNGFYRARYKVISQVDKVKYQFSSYSTNIFREPEFSFEFINDIDLTNLTDAYGRIITELFIYFKYKPKASEMLLYQPNGQKIMFDETNNLEDVLLGDEYFLNKEAASTEITNKINYFINTREIRVFTNVNETQSEIKRLELKYNPFHRIEIIPLSSYIENGDIRTDIIPQQAFKIDETAFAWRDYELKETLNRPFINNKHYIFENIVLSTEPNLENENTLDFYGRYVYNQRTRTNLLNDQNLRIC